MGGNETRLIDSSCEKVNNYLRKKLYAMSIMESAIYLWQSIVFGVFKKDPHIDFSEFPSTLRFISHYDSKNDIHWLECPELPEFHVTGKNKEELARNVTDTLLVYFDVPTYFARKFRPDNIRFNFENKKTGEHEYVSLDYMEELNRVLA